jgi:hypothetical protein
VFTEFTGAKCSPSPEKNLDDIVERLVTLKAMRSYFFDAFFIFKIFKVYVDAI